MASLAWHTLQANAFPFLLPYTALNGKRGLSFYFTFFSNSKIKPSENFLVRYRLARNKGDTIMVHGGVGLVRERVAGRGSGATRAPKKEKIDKTAEPFPILTPVVLKIWCLCHKTAYIYKTTNTPMQWTCFLNCEFGNDPVWSHLDTFGDIWNPKIKCTNTLEVIFYFKMKSKKSNVQTWQIDYTIIEELRGTTLWLAHLNKNLFML